MSDFNAIMSDWLASSIASKPPAATDDRLASMSNVTANIAGVERLARVTPPVNARSCDVRVQRLC